MTDDADTIAALRARVAAAEKAADLSAALMRDSMAAIDRIREVFNLADTLTPLQIADIVVDAIE